MEETLEVMKVGNVYYEGSKYVLILYLSSHM